MAFAFPWATAACTARWPPGFLVSALGGIAFSESAAPAGLVAGIVSELSHVHRGCRPACSVSGRHWDGDGGEVHPASGGGGIHQRHRRASRQHADPRTFSASPSPSAERILAADGHPSPGTLNPRRPRPRHWASLPSRPCCLAAAGATGSGLHRGAARSTAAVVFSLPNDPARRFGASRAACRDSSFRPSVSSWCRPVPAGADGGAAQAIESLMSAVVAIEWAGIATTRTSS